MLLLSLILGLVIGTYVGKLLVQHFYNGGVSPFETVKEVSDYEIHKGFEETSSKP